MSGEDSPEEQLFEVAVTLSYTELFDCERPSAEAAREFGHMVVQEDLNQGAIDAESFEIEATAREVDQ